MIPALFAPLWASSEEPLNFADDVLPILRDKCFACHGPDSEKRKAKLRLDTREGLFSPRPSGGTPVSPYQPTESAVIDRISAQDEDRMPPPDSAKPLAAAQIATLTRWVREGARWSTHWAFAAIGSPQPPAVDPDPWVRNGVDWFIRDRQRSMGLVPSGEADKRTLIRRLYLDLHGLPPSPEAVAAFVSDKRPDAYAALVDSLLASPRYGERWARHWLDVVHYGDTHGYDKDKRRPHAWPFRDYVIQSLNEDKAYGRFVEEQLAGDVLFPDDPQATVGTGFIAAGPWDFVGHVELREGTVDKKITRNLDRDDMVTNTMATFTSLTVQCARCHDHKFDPISQEDYYSLQAVFAGVERADRPYDADPTIVRKRAVLAARLAALEPAGQALRTKADALQSPQRTHLEKQVRGFEKRVEQYEKKDSPSNGYHSAIEASDNKVKWVQIDLGESFIIDRLKFYPARPTDFPDTPGFGFPRRFKIELSEDPAFQTPAILVDYTEADSPIRTDKPYVLPVDKKPGRYVRMTATRLWKRTGDYCFALAELEVWCGDKNRARNGDVSALDSIDAGRWHTRHLIDGFDSRRRIGPIVKENAADSLAQTRQSLQTARAELEALKLAALSAAERKTLAATETSIAKTRQALDDLPEPRMVYAATAQFKKQGNFKPPNAIRDIQLLRRGDVGQPAGSARPGAVGLIATLPARFDLPEGSGEGARRAALARWITDQRNPLTWRSIVNRVWHYHFGRGIVDTPNDFGRRGSPPTHPELLDWLARGFLESGQSLKWLHKMILTSATYRQQSNHNLEFAEIDGANRYHWRMNRRQLDAEALRDSVLMVSGMLDLTMGGPGIDYFRFEDDHSPRYLYDQFDPNAEGAHRRSIYRFIVRSVPDPFMTCLDCADPAQSVPVRNQTLTALQALATFNNPLMIRQAVHFAHRLRALSDNAVEQIDSAFQLALARHPSTAERRVLDDYRATHGLAAMCRLIFNSNEFMFVD